MGFVFDTSIRSSLGPQIEAVVRRDVGSATPVPYTFVDDPAVEAAAATDPPDDLGHRIGLAWTPIDTIRFELPWPAGATLTARLVKFGLVTYVGSLRYVVELDAALGEAVSFQGKDHDGPAFVGGTAAAHLNDVPGLVKRVSKVLRAEYFTGMMWVKGEGCGLTVDPAQHGSTLSAWTYSRGRGPLDTDVTTDAGEILEIAQAIQRAL